MKKRFHISSLLPKYILLYTLMVFAPVIIIFFSLLQSNRALEREILNSNKISINLVQDALDITFADANDTLKALGENPALTRYALTNSPINAINALRETKSAHNYINEIVLFSQGNDLFYTSNGIYTDDALPSAGFMQDFFAAGYTQQDWNAFLTTAPILIYRPINLYSTTDTLYLFSPLYYEDQPQTELLRSAALAIRQQEMQALFEASCTTEADNILLLNKDLDIVSALYADGNTEDALKVQLFLKENPFVLENGYIELEEHGLLIFATRSEKTGLSYVRFLPRAVAFQALDSQVVYTIAMAVLTVLIAVVLISLTLNQSYTPIHKLAKWVRSQQPDAQWKSRNELTLFQTALSDAYSSNEALAETVSMSRQGMIDHMLAGLLSDSFSSKQEFLDLCEKLDVCLDKPYYAVCSILFEDADELPEFSQLLDIVRADLPPAFCLAVKDMLLERKIVLIIGCDNNDLDSYIILATDIKNRLLAQESLLTSVGIGSFYDSYDLIGKSYLDSQNALDYRMVYGKDCLITPDIYNRSSLGFSEGYPSSDLELLDSSLASRNVEMAATVIRRINENIKLKNYNLHAAKYICYDIFSIFRKDADLSDLGNGRTLPQTLDITKLTGYGTIDEFFSALLDMIESKFNDTQMIETHQQANIGAKLLEYADRHCLSYNFQAKNMAEAFNISPQYMRRLFKSHTGMSISEYVANKRLEKSMFLLTQTDMNLQDIVVEIGNSDISGFVRFFKQKTGMTPGQYRKANQQTK